MLFAVWGLNFGDIKAYKQAEGIGHSRKDRHTHTPQGMVLVSLRCTPICHGMCLYWLLTFYPPLMTVPDLLSGHVQPQSASKPAHPYGSWGTCCFYKRCLNIWIIKFFPHYMRETNLGPERRVRRSLFHSRSGSSTKTQPKRQNIVLITEASLPTTNYSLYASDVVTMEMRGPGGSNRSRLPSVGG